jgi:hypothetical protein
MEFHISREIRERLSLDDLLFSFTGNVIFANVAASRKLARNLEELHGPEAHPDKAINAGALFAMGLIDELSHALVARYRQDKDPAVLSEALRWFSNQVTPVEMDRLLLSFTDQFPNVAIYRNQISPKQWLDGNAEGISNREAAFEEMMLLWLANINPSFAPFKVLFEDAALKKQTAYQGVTATLPNFFVTRPPVAPGLGSLLDVLCAPMLASPDSLTGQLDFIRENWSQYLGEDLRRVLLAIDILREEEVAIWMRFHPAGPDNHRHGAPGFGGEGFIGDEFIGFEDDFVTGSDGIRRRRYAVDYQAPLHEYEAFSADQAWMPNVVLIAKNTYVWLEQLSKKYGRHIYRLDQIPDAELRLLASRGITGLWLIGLWERSRASRTIKRLRGNADAVASAYSLKDYSIAEDLGGEAAYENLRDRAALAGLKLASDMVPNHMGIDSDWVIEHPEWFLSRWDSPFPVYGFEGPDLSTDSRVEIKIEDHYYDQTDAAVVFRLRHHRDGATRFVYHGNDGTTFAWNDTAQLDYSKAEVREHVIQVILNVARRFPIIRFDAAMVLAKRHVQRLWFPLPGAGGSIPSRAENALSEEAFEALMPHEFWREVVDRVAVEVPGTLLLAEAFWLLEGYFVRTLGMHRVYNSAFMNMLRDEENAKYRSYLKKTVEFDPDILKRYVNFMSNPDERTAIDQFGAGDKYFGVSVLLATLPGLPMFGHGQIEGYTERYGMDFKQARLDEYANDGLIARHDSLIAPLLKNRQLFAESTNFVLYDFWTDHGTVDENVFAYSNRFNDQRGIVFYNNTYGSTRGTIHMSVGFLEKNSGSLQQRSLAEGIALPDQGSTIIAYRDAVVGLEYLRRVDDFRNHGLTLDLRGYQHVVLLNWRELQSSAAYPWDSLCDALNGAGVYDIRETLSKLRLRPVLGALREAISETNVCAFVKVAEESIVEPASEEPKQKVGPKAASTKKKPVSSVEADSVAAGPDPRLLDFIAKAHIFAARVTEMSNAGGAAPAVAATDASEDQEKDKDMCAALAAASVYLPSLAPIIPKALQRSAQSVLPLTTTGISHEQVWAPVLAWIVFQIFPSQKNALALFDDLQLRPALAEAFSSVGLEGELAWKAAAQVRVLLRIGTETSAEAALHSVEFWQDPDVRWLAGSNVSHGTEFFHLERFEELVSWLQLPALLDLCMRQPISQGDSQSITDMLQEITRTIHIAGYKVEPFLKLVVKGKEKTSNGSLEPEQASDISQMVTSK